MPWPHPEFIASRVLSRLGWFAAGAAVGSAAALGGSVGWVRARSHRHLHPPDGVPAAPVAMILGAQVYPDGTPSRFLTARLDLGKRLYDAGVVEQLLVSGNSRAREYDEPAAMRRYLIDAGVPAEAILVDDFGVDTYASSVRARDVFGLDRLIVVTQDYHLPRAVATCRALGIDAVGVGDTTVRSTGGAWVEGYLRDQLACIKAVTDLVTRRRPEADPRTQQIHR